MGKQGPRRRLISICREASPVRNPLLGLRCLQGTLLEASRGQGPLKLYAEVLDNADLRNRAALARKAKGWLGNEAATFVDLMNGEDDDTKDAVMRGSKDGR